MKFDEFYQKQKALLDNGIDYGAGLPAFWDLVRLWNAMAQFHPELVEDVITIDKGSTADSSTILTRMRSIPNPFGDRPHYRPEDVMTIDKPEPDAPQETVESSKANKKKRNGEPATTSPAPEQNDG